MGHRHRDMYLWIPDHGFRLVFMASCKKAPKTKSLVWLFQLSGVKHPWLQMPTPALRLTSRQGAGE